jgi:hypothetical protein
MKGFVQLLDKLVSIGVLDPVPNESLSVFMTSNYIEMSISINEFAASCFQQKFSSVSWNETFQSEHEWYNISFDENHCQIKCYFGLSSIVSVMNHFLDFVSENFTILTIERENLDFAIFNEITKFIIIDPELSIRIFLFHMATWNIELIYLNTILEDSIQSPFFRHSIIENGEFWNLRNYFETGSAQVLLGESSKNQIAQLIKEFIEIMKPVYVGK